jgi:DNA polymerase-3 subunit epsilon
VPESDDRRLRLKPRGGAGLIAWEPVEGGDDFAPVSPGTPLEEAEFVAVDIETTGNRPFLVLEIGAERFRLSGSLGLFDTLVHTRAPINPYAKRRHLIEREMLVDAPQFGDARRAFLHFARGAVLVEHSHDAFDTYLIGRGLKSPLQHPIIDTSALARLVLDLPSGQTPGLARVVEELELDVDPQHAALTDAAATAAVFRELVRRARDRFGWRVLGDALAVLTRPEIDRSALEGRPRVPKPRPHRRRSTRTGSSGGQAPDAPGLTDPPR